MQEGRWTTITPSQFVHEREALAHIQQLLPDAEPYRAWSNFTFTADSGHVYEVDLLVAARGGLYLIEIKSLRGKLTNSGSNWILFSPNGGTRTFDNPLHLADSKAKRLKPLLEIERKKKGIKEPIPFVQAVVFLSERTLAVNLMGNHLQSVFGPENGTTLPKIWSDLLEQPPKNEHNRVSPTLSKALPELLKQVGVARSRKHYQIGSWQLDGKPFDIGPTWQDHVARHAQLDNEVRRVRIYLVERNAVQEERASIERAAKREMQALHGINHPGIVQADAMEQHEAGPALVFRYDPRALRLDHYLSQYGARLDVETRVAMVRQLGETIAYAHRRHLHHRALSARSVLVTPQKSFRGTEDEAWLRPHLQISDWHAASRTPDATRGSSPAVLQTAHVGMHLEKSSEGYLAPEFREPDADPVALDVFGLGTLAYLLLSNHPPATSRQELVSRLATDNGLRPSASADSVSEFMDEVVQAATAPQPSQRIATAEEFLELLWTVEEEVTAPPAPSVHPEPDPEPEEVPDLLEARGGDELGGWRITKRLGTGSTSRAFLAEGVGSNPEKQVVLKVALSDEKASRLDHEARILRKLGDSRIIRLARQEPLTFGKRTFLVLDHAGDKTVARKLREDGRLTVDELETYSDYLFGAVDYLAGEGVHHRDIKPDNIAIRIRPNRTRQLVLFDFSLAAIDIKQIEAGTPHYLDPFLGEVRRPVYDDHAERYAVAVTLHEMASGELPVWGDGKTEAKFTDGPVQLASEAFDPAIRDGLIGFFGRALDRVAGKRFGTLKEMRDAWQQVFHQADALSPVTTHHPEPTDEPEADLKEARDREASVATRATALEAAGLSPRAVSAAQRIDGVTTVGDLLAVASRVVFNLPGMGFNTRKELQQRIRQWRERLGEREASPLAPEGRVAVRVEVEAAEREADSEGTVGAGDLLRLGLDAVATLLVPALQKNTRNASEVDATRLFLRLPDTAGALPDLPPWPPQPAVANVVGVTAGRIAQILGKQRKRWASDAVLRALRAELIEVLAENGRVMGSSELAATLLSRRGASGHDPEIRSALALAAVRAAVEIDSTDPSSRFLTRRHGERLLVALEVSPDDAPDTPSAPRLLDYADALGKVADRLAVAEVLPSPATVLRELAAVRQVPGVVLDERRMVRLAAVASQHAAASPRLELYPRDLDPVRALRLAQAGVISGPANAGLTEAHVRERVSARFPDLEPLPGDIALGRLLTAAGFDLRWDHSGRYVRSKAQLSSSASMLARRLSTAPSSAHWTVVDSPVLAGALRAEEILSSAAEEGFRALTVRVNRYPRAVDELTRRFGARPTNVAALFMAALRARVAERAKPTWETLLRADTAEPGSRAALKLGEYTAAAWEDVRPTLVSAVDRSLGPVLLHDSGLFARYDAMGVLDEVVSRSRDGHGAVWLLCPVEDPGGQPRLDGVLVPHLATEHVPLVDAWVDNEHRGGERAS